MPNGHHQLQQQYEEKKLDGGDDGGEGFKRDMMDLEEMLSKLNPMAKEFVPPSLASVGSRRPADGCVSPGGGGWHFGYNANGFIVHQLYNSDVPNENSFRRKKNGYTNGKRRMNSWTSMAQRHDVIKRTVYVSDIDHQVEGSNSSSVCLLIPSPSPTSQLAHEQFLQGLRL